MSQNDSLDTLITLHLDGQLTAQQCDQLASLLEESESAREAFWQTIHLHHATVEIADQHWGQISIEAGSNEPTVADSIDALFAEPFSFDPPSAKDIGAVDSKEMLRIVGYVVSKAIRKRALALSAAAVFVIAGLVVFLVLQGGEPGQPVAIEGLQIEPPVSTPIEGQLDLEQQEPNQQAVVATLTAERDAAWGGAAIATGALLRAGDRFTLTQGFAEITTRHGAVANIQAPATIELLDSPNAIYLHAGKLVGICETQPSKGFLVRTPQLSITDLGTRFGVEVTALSTTQVHVFDGEVQVIQAKAPAETDPTDLVAGESASLSAATGQIVAIQYDAERFAELLPRMVALPGTGQHIAVRQADPNWQIVAIAGQPLETPQAVRVFNNPMLTRSVPNDPETAQWIGMRPTQNPAPGSGITYRFQTRISLPETMDPDTALLALSYSSDDYLRAVYINGQRREIDFPLVEGWTIRDVVLREHFVAGENTIAFEIENYRLDSQPDAGPVALYLRWAWQEPAITRSKPTAGEGRTQRREIDTHVSDFLADASHHHRE